MSTDQPASASWVPSQDERTLACISHLTVFVSSIGFLIAIGLWIYLHMQKKYPYATFQAGQAVVFQLVVMVMTFLVIIIVMAVMFGAFGIGALASSSPESGAAFGAIVVISVMLMVSVLALLTLALYAYAIYASVRSYQSRPFRIPGIAALVEAISPMPNVPPEGHQS
jgi:uncharacterized Tic20 family protein